MYMCAIDIFYQTKFVSIKIQILKELFVLLLYFNVKRIVLSTDVPFGKAVLWTYF